MAFPGNHGTGEVKLQSSDPTNPALIDPKFLAHSFDKRLAIESIRETLDFLHKPAMAKSSLRLAAGPAGNINEDILVSDTRGLFRMKEPANQ